MNDLDINSILPELKRERVEVPAWKGAVYLQELTAFAREEYDAGLWLASEKKDQDSNLFRLKLVALCLCDKDGGELFNYDKLSNLPQGPVLDLLYPIAQKLNATASEGVEEEAKNF